MSSVAIPPLARPAFARHSAAAVRAHIESSLDEQLSSTLLLRERAAPVTVPIGIAALDAHTGGLPRGALSEIAGPASSGRTGVMLAALAGATGRQEVCALVDASDSFDPASAQAAGVDLDRLLWIRCTQRAVASDHKNEARRHANVARLTSPRFAFAGVLEQVLKVTDLLLQSGGFGMVILDLGDIPSASARRVPLTSWFRFRRTVEPTATVLLLIEQEPCAKTCASLVLQLQPETVCATDAFSAALEVQPEMEFSLRSADSPMIDKRIEWLRPGKSAGAGPGHLASAWEPLKNGVNPLPQIPESNAVSHAALLRGMRFRADVLRSWAQRKPARSVGACFELRTAS
jgi:hypothetical protein